MAITHTTPVGGNVFADLGIPRGEAESLKVRSSLMIQIRKVIERRNLREPDAARVFGVSEATIRDLARGRIDQLTTDSLVSMLGRAGHRVETRVRGPGSTEARS